MKITSILEIIMYSCYVISVLLALLNHKSILTINMLSWAIWGIGFGTFISLLLVEHYL